MRECATSYRTFQNIFTAYSHPRYHNKTYKNELRNTVESFYCVGFNNYSVSCIHCKLFKGYRLDAGGSRYRLKKNGAMKIFLTISGLSNNSLICHCINDHRIYGREIGGFMGEGKSRDSDPSDSVFRYFCVFHNSYLIHYKLK